MLVALVLGTVAKRLGISPLVGYLMAGVAIGPHTPGFVGNAELAAQLADVGVVLLMFGVGLGFSIRDMWSVRRLAVPGAVLTCGSVVVCGALLGLLFGWPFGGALVLGMCLATASTVVIVRGMSELGLLRAAPGRIAVGWSVVEDLVTVLLLVVLPAMAPGGLAGGGAPPLWQAIVLSLLEVLALGAIVVWGGGLIVPHLLALVAGAQSRELFTLAVLAMALGVAFLAAEVFGVSVALGAFFAGMVVGRSDLAHQAAADALPMRDAFAVLFFVAIGMLFDPSFVLRSPLSVVGVLSCVLLVKPAVAASFLLWTGEPPRTALSVAAGLAQVSEFSFVLAGLALSLGILPAGGRDLVLSAALVSIAVSPALFRSVPVLARVLSRRSHRPNRRRTPHAELTEFAPAVAGGLQDHVVVCGHGRVGSVITGFLAARGVPFVVVDLDRAVVGELRRAGKFALWGDAASPVLLDRAEIRRARALVLCLPDPVAHRLAIEHARRERSDIRILVRVATRDELDALTALPGVCPVHGERELGLAMARHLLEALGASSIEAEAAVRRPLHEADRSPRLFEVGVPAGGAVVGRTVAELGLPPQALVVAIVRGREHLVARGPTMLAAGDRLLLLADADEAHRVEATVAAPVPSTEPGAP